MSEIAKAYVQIEPTFNGVKSSIEKEFGGAGESGGQSFGAGFAKVVGGAGGAIGTAGKAIAGAVGVSAAAIGALGTEFVNATGDVASYGDNIDKMAQKMGMSVESYQEWDAVMQHSGTSMESMKASMKTLANAAETNSDAFKELGISQEDLQKMSQEQLFEATITALQQVEDDTQRTYLAGKTLGKGATELGALLNTSAEDTQAMRDRVRELGGVMSEDAVKAAAAYQDQLQDMQTAFSGISRNMLSEFLPAMTTVMSGLTEVFSGNSEAGIGQINEGITKIMEGITQALPELMTIASSIIESLATAIIQNLPQLAQTGMEVIMQLATFIIENLPMLIESASQIIVQLALGIAQALPTLIPTIIQVVLTISEYLIDNIDLLIDCAVQLMTGLTLGLVNALPILIEKAPVIIGKLVMALIQAAPKLMQAGLECIKKLATALQSYWSQLTAVVPGLMERLKSAFIDLAGKFFEIGSNIVEGIRNGISEAWDHLVEWFNEKVSGLVKGVSKVLGIESPSKVFAKEVGQWIPAGIAEGIEDGMGPLDKTIESMSTDMINDVAISGNMTMASGDTNFGALYNLLAQYLPRIASGENVNITLSGDMGLFFRAMQQESVRNTQIVGTGSVLAAT